MKFLLSILVTAISIGASAHEVTPEEMKRHIEQATADLSIVNSQMDNFVRYDDTLQIDEGLIQRTSSNQWILFDVVESFEAWVFHLFQTEWSFNKNGEIDGERHSEIEVPISKRPGLQIENVLRIKSDEDNVCDGVDQDDGDGIVYDCIKYFNLVHDDRRSPPPVAVQAKPACMNIPDCLMQIRYLQYDVVKWRNNAVVNSQTVTAEIAPEVPDLVFYSAGLLFHLPPVLNFCVEGFQLFADGNHKVKSCKTLIDFN